jgi:cholesterol transport system auxiliary component
MSKVFAAGIAMAIVLTGCISLPHPGKGEHRAQYTLAAGAANTSTPPAAKGAKARAKVLKVAEVAVPAWLNSEAIFYRLDYRNNSRIAAYSQSTWVSSPATMLTALLERKLAASPAWSAVIGPDDAATAAYTLRVQLMDFQQDFSSPKQSHCLLVASATLIDNNAQAVAGQKTFTQKQPAPSPDAAGGVQCLSQASLRFTKELRQWLKGIVSS